MNVNKLFQILGGKEQNFVFFCKIFRVYWDMVMFFLNKNLKKIIFFRKINRYSKMKQKSYERKFFE